MRHYALAVVLAARPGHAAPVSVPVGPSTARIGLTVFAIGVWPVAGQFNRFSGRLTVDPASPGDCHVSVAVDVASLDMSSRRRTNMALGASLLDATQYPSLSYVGTCSVELASGRLTLHGVERDLSLVPKREGDKIIAVGSLRRQDFGIVGLPGLIGQRVDLSLSITLPTGLAERLARK